MPNITKLKLQDDIEYTLSSPILLDQEESTSTTSAPSSNYLKTRLDNMDELIESLSNSLASNSTFLNNLNGVINKAFQASDGQYMCPKIVTFPDVTHIVITHIGTSGTNYGPVLACGTFGIFYFFVQGTNIPDVYQWKSETGDECSASLNGLVTTISTGNRWSHTMVIVGGNLGRNCTIEGQVNT